MGWFWASPHFASVMKLAEKMQVSRLRKTSHTLERYAQVFEIKKDYLKCNKKYFLQGMFMIGTAMKL
jgi:hypothetical protein